jgi:aminoglycoside 3-N-acetyltransferase
MGFEPMTVTAESIQLALRQLGLQGRDVAVHSSLRSFGHVDGGAQTVVRALLQICGTVLMPSFCETGMTNPPPEERPAQNGWDHERYWIDTAGLTPFDPATFGETSEIGVGEMGRIAEAFLCTEGAVRSKHPSVSWTANGPLAAWYVANHPADDPNLPLKRLLERQGRVLLLGVGLEACTAVHLAEERAGRRPFVRWILYTDGAIHRVREYGCSDAFPRLAPYVESVAKRAVIGQCQAVLYPIEPLVNTLARLMVAHPELTLCARTELCRCQDAAKGGPIETKANSVRTR